MPMTPFDATLAFEDSDALAPPPSRFERCALVGNADILRGRGLGAKVDGHDTVIRINRLPVAAFGADVGNRTDILFTRAFGSRHEVANGSVFFRLGDGISIPKSVKHPASERWCDSHPRSGCPIHSMPCTRHV